MAHARIYTDNKQFSKGQVRMKLQSYEYRGGFEIARAPVHL